MIISDVNTPELWVVGLALVVLTVTALLEGAVLLGVRALGVDESFPVAVAVVGTTLALW